MESVAAMCRSRIRYRTGTQPFLKWKIHHRCNFSCAYCRALREPMVPSLRDAERAVQRIVEVLPGTWKVVLTGGELTSTFRLTSQIVGDLGEAGYPMRLISNFSASARAYARLIRISNGRLREFFLTRHAQYLSAREVVKRAAELRAEAGDSVAVTVRQVILPEDSQLKEAVALRTALSAEGVSFYPLRYVSFRGKQGQGHTYERVSSELLSAVFSEFVFAPRRKGTYCPAGFEYAYLNPRGELYSCMPYKYRKEGYLGSIWDEELPALKSEPTLCAVEYCSCVPGR